MVACVGLVGGGICIPDGRCVVGARRETTGDGGVVPRAGCVEQPLTAVPRACVACDWRWREHLSSLFSAMSILLLRTFSAAAAFDLLHTYGNFSFNA